MRDDPKGGDLDPAVDDRKRCKKNSPSVLSCTGKGTKEGCDLAAESSQFTADETGMGQFL